MVRATYLRLLAVALPVSVTVGEVAQRFDDVMLLQVRGEVKADPSLPAGAKDQWISEEDIKMRYSSEQIDAMMNSGKLLTRQRYRIIAKPRECEGSDCDSPQVAAVSSKVVENRSATEADVEKIFRTDQLPAVGVPVAASTTTTSAPDTTTVAKTTTALKTTSASPKVVDKSSTTEADVEKAFRTDQIPAVGVPVAASTTTTSAPDTTTVAQTTTAPKTTSASPKVMEKSSTTEVDVEKAFRTDEIPAVGVPVAASTTTTSAPDTTIVAKTTTAPKTTSASPKVMENSSATEADVEEVLRTDQAPAVGVPVAASTTTTSAPDTTTVATTTAAPESTSKPDCTELGTCAIYEDPHIRVFDGRQISLIGSRGSQNRELTDEDAGDMWLVKSSDISIQARYLPDPDLPPGNLFVRAVAVAGPFLDGNAMIVGPLDEEITWNDEPILKSQTGDFFATLANGSVHAKRHLNSHLVQDMTQTNAGVDIQFPLGVRLTVNRYKKHVNVHIEMPAAPGGQQGLCGNFNCNADDDGMQMILKDRDPKVLPEDALVSQ